MVLYLFNFLSSLKQNRKSGGSLKKKKKLLNNKNKYPKGHVLKLIDWLAGKSPQFSGTVYLLLDTILNIVSVC